MLRNQSVKHSCHYYRGLSKITVYKRFQKTLREFSSKTINYPKFKGRYILVTDALWYRFGSTYWTLFLFLLKPVRRNTAYVLNPVMLMGGESFESWKGAIESIPFIVRKSIIAITTDNFRSSARIANYFRWPHQLCQFHLIAALQKRRGKRKRAIPGVKLRESIYRVIRRLLETPDPEETNNLIHQLNFSIGDPKCPESIRMIAREFLREINQYRTYLKYPDLTIPRTTGAAESLGNLIRNKTNRLKSPDSVYQWSSGFIKMKKTINCKRSKVPNYQPN
ncbi:MAG: hypothetical protein NTX00_04495 [Candidatus Parcubacteria bacterium]|nr:hypothetical protein [Candidatus Parcubacteria bacterium]